MHTLHRVKSKNVVTPGEVTIALAVNPVTLAIILRPKTDENEG
jgi:hypothetical protein